MSEVLIYETERGQTRVDVRLVKCALGKKVLVMCPLINLMADDPRLNRTEATA
jgi:hypothetical protein